MTGGDALRHGTQYGYRRGCRCDDCKAAKSAADRASHARHREKRLAAMKQRYDADPESARRRIRDYYATNEAYREATKARAASWPKENPERSSATKKAYAKANAARLKQAAKVLYDAKREERIAYSVAWARANPDRVREAKRRWKQRNPGNTLLHVNRRRFRKAAATIVLFSDAQLDERLSMFPGCWVCGGEPNAVDHVKPLAKGGPHCLANLRPICTSCNSSKRDRWPFEPTSV